MRRFLFLIACVAMNLQLFSQELTEFKGHVIDAATGTPAVGVKVQAYNNPRDLHTPDSSHQPQSNAGNL